MSRQAAGKVPWTIERGAVEDVRGVRAREVEVRVRMLWPWVARMR